MRIAIIHYHLSPGGVTTVIRAASRGLAAEGIAHVVLCGTGTAAGVPVRHLPGLGYIRESQHSAPALLLEMQEAAAEALGGPPDVWHFHNHSLGKNPLIPAVVALLASTGERLILQMHDMAEDGRPGNHALIADQPHLYPYAPGILYAFLNERDLRRFTSSGLPEGNAFLLPNPVPTASASGQAIREDAPLVLYPSRAIRRKNLGELLLLSMFAPQGTRFAVTQAPENLTARAIHDRWEMIAEDLALPVAFHVADRIPPDDLLDSSYESWLHSASHLVTTSVAEGFGMIYPEAAALGKRLIGREIPWLPQHRQPSLYQRVEIPQEWIPAGRLERHLSRHLAATFRLYRRDLPPHGILTARSALLQQGMLDFGNLPETLQRDILHLLREDASLRPTIHGLPIDQWLRDAMAYPPAPYAGQGILEDRYGHTLRTIYQQLMEASPSAVSHVSPGRVLDACLSPAHFHFLLSPPETIRAVIFDIYGTLLIAPPGAVKPDPAFDPILRELLSAHGFHCGEAPTQLLHEAVKRHHAMSQEAYPEIDLRKLWQEILHTTADMEPLLTAIEEKWHPCEAMPHASETLHRLAGDGILLGVLSNAQANTLPALCSALGSISGLLAPDLSILSYQHGMAKPSPALFHLLAERLAAHAILPCQTLFVGNDPAQDILPAAAAGFRTALFTGHPSSFRPGTCDPDITLQSLSEIPLATSSFC